VTRVAFLGNPFFKFIDELSLEGAPAGKLL
jgi:hypothetical protein